MSAKTPRAVANGRRKSGMTPVNLYQRTKISTPECYVPIAVETPPVDRGDPPCAAEESSSVVVAVRVRPLSLREESDPSVASLVDVTHNSISIVPAGADPSASPLHHFVYDHCLASTDKLNLRYADQQRVYETVARPLLDRAFEGYNACLFAYGQTGSGKSYSIMGRDPEVGIIPRFGRELFERIGTMQSNTQVCVEMSYFQIYNEKIYDLLAQSGGNTGDKAATMRVREHPVLGPYVEDLSTFPIVSYEELAEWLALGNTRRATAATSMNEKSSRSHSVFTLVVKRVHTDVVEGELLEHTRKSKINIVDLAGSERLSTTGHVAGLRVKEGISINQSLLTLGKVISCLAARDSAQHRGRVFVPYRESVLTWLLKESLGGNSKTTMLATISPANVHLEDTLNTLRYARQVRSIVNVARVNEDPKARLIRELMAKIEWLRGTKAVDLGGMTSSETEIRALRSRLRDAEEQHQQDTESWKARLRQAERQKAEEADKLEKTGVALQIDNQQPNLVNLNEDPQLAEALLYLLSEGDTKVGRGQGEAPQSIRLQGSLIQDDHCILRNKNGTVTLVPRADATYVNGHLVTTNIVLHHGDRVVLGSDHYFRFNNPLEVAKGTRHSTCKDYSFARNELFSVQDAKMKEELERAREKTRQEMLLEIEALKKEADFELDLQKQGFEQHIDDLQRALEGQAREMTEVARDRNQLEMQKKVLERRVQSEEVATTGTPKLRRTASDFLATIAQHLLPDEFHLTGNSELFAAEEAGLFELQQLTEEANSLCRRLELDYKFHQLDRITENGFESIVKVEDCQRSLVMELPVDELRLRLNVLKRMGEGDKDLHPFDEGRYRWQPDDHLPLAFSPKITESLMEVCSPSSLSLCIAEDRQSPGATTSSCVRRLIRRSLSARQPAAPPAVDVFAVCRRGSSAMIDCFVQMSSSALQLDVSRVLASVVDLHEEARELSARSSDPDCPQRFAIRLNSFLLHATRLSSLFSLRSQKVCKMSEDYVECVRKLGCMAAEMMHSPSEANPATRSVPPEMEDLVYRCCNLIGQISTSMGIPLQSQDEECQLKPDIGFHFLCGLEVVTGNALRTAVCSLNDCQQQMVKLSSGGVCTKKNSAELVQSASETISAVGDWARIYKRVHRLTSKDRENDAHRLVSISNQAQQMVINFSSLTESVLNLQSDVEGHVRDEHVDLPAVLTLIAEIRGSVESLVSLFQFFINYLQGRGVGKQLIKEFQDCVRRISNSTHVTKKALRQLIGHRAPATPPAGKVGDSPTKKSNNTNGNLVTTVTASNSPKTELRAPKKSPVEITRPQRRERPEALTIAVTPESILRASPRRALGYVDVSHSPITPTVEQSPTLGSPLQTTSIWSSTLFSPVSCEVSPCKVMTNGQ